MTDTAIDSNTGRNEPQVRFENVQKTYDGEVLVVKDLNLEIEHGEFLTLLGPSGSGKTTTLMMMAGFESTTHGDIILNGRSLKLVPPHKAPTCHWSPSLRGNSVEIVPGVWPGVT